MLNFNLLTTILLFSGLVLKCTSFEFSGELMEYLHDTLLYTHLKLTDQGDLYDIIGDVPFVKSKTKNILVEAVEEDVLPIVIEVKNEHNLKERFINLWMPNDYDPDCDEEYEEDEEEEEECEVNLNENSDGIFIYEEISEQSLKIERRKRPKFHVLSQLHFKYPSEKNLSKWTHVDRVKEELYKVNFVDDFTFKVSDLNYTIMNEYLTEINKKLEHEIEQIEEWINEYNSLRNILKISKRSKLDLQALN